jgi:hypothetical protein
MLAQPDGDEWTMCFLKYMHHDVLLAVMTCTCWVAAQGGEAVRRNGMDVFYDYRYAMPISI